MADPAPSFTFNSVALPLVEAYRDRATSPIDLTSKIDRDGADWNTGRLGPRAIDVVGKIQSTTQAGVRTAWQTVVNALFDAEGGNKLAYLTAFDDRKIYAQAAQHDISYAVQDAGMLSATYSISFVAKEPFWTDLNTSTVSSSGVGP